jgi:cell division protein FtsB
MPSSSGENKRRTAPKKKPEEPQFLRKRFLGAGRGATTKVFRILGWAIAVWFLSAILFGETGFFSLMRMNSMKDSLDSEIRALEEARAATEARRDALEKDPATIEEVAREEYGMMKDGETVYRVVLEEDE